MVGVEVGQEDVGLLLPGPQFRQSPPEGLPALGHAEAGVDQQIFSVSPDEVAVQFLQRVPRQRDRDAPKAG